MQAQSHDIPTHRNPTTRASNRWLISGFCWLLIGLTFGLEPAAAECRPDAGISGVAIAFVNEAESAHRDRGAGGDPRAQHARISSSLAAELGFRPTSGVGAMGQIRVHAPQVDVDIEPLFSHSGVAVFSVVEVFPQTTHEVRIWAARGPADTASGEFRLFEHATPVDLSAIEVVVHGRAPSSTRIRRHGAVASVAEHFCEPEDGSGLRESVALVDDKRFALVVPHGGEIASGTSDQIRPIVTALGERGIDTNLWHVEGEWFTGRDTAEHWRLRDAELTTASFPGLATMLAAPEAHPGRAFHYAASLHALDFSKEGLTIAGPAHREAQCLIAGRVRQRLAATGHEVPAVVVWGRGDDPAERIELPHGDGSTTITGEQGARSADVAEGRSLVDRLAPNPAGIAGFGGFRIEQSAPSRHASTYRDTMAVAIADAIGELIVEPRRVDPMSTRICDALAAGRPVPAGDSRDLMASAGDADDRAEAQDDRGVRSSS